MLTENATPAQNEAVKNGDPLDGGQFLPQGEEGVGQMHEHFGASWKHRNLGMEATNAFEHYAYFKTHPTEPSLDDSVLKQPQPAIIVGSGPSLDEVVDVLGDWKGGLFCSSSHITTLAYYGVYPTHFASPDPKGSMDEWAMPDINQKYLAEKSIYACTPIQPFEYTEFFKGRRQWYLIFDPTKEWYAQILKPTFSWIKNLLLPFSANVPALLGIAQFLGYHPIYLIGADACGTRYTEWRYHNGEWDKSVGGHIPITHAMKTHHGKVSNPNLMWAWRGLLCVARCNLEMAQGKDWHVYNCARDGVLVDTLPFADLRKVIASGGQEMPLWLRGWTREKQVFELDVALARFNTFVIPIHNGIESGTRVHIGSSYEDIQKQIEAINANLYGGVDAWGKLTEDQRQLVIKTMQETGQVYDPQKVRGPKVPEYMAYVKRLKETIRSRNERQTRLTT